MQQAARLDIENLDFQFPICRLKMRFSTRVYILVGLFVLVQLTFGAQKLKGSDSDEKGKVSEFHKHTEEFIEKVLYLVKDYHTRVRNVYKCIPQKIVDPAKDILKHSMECLDEVEKKLDVRRITKNSYEKLFLKCLAEHKKEIENLTGSIDSTVDLCPENVTEKTYQIDITTALKKAFDISFKKGSKIIRKTILLEAKESDPKDEDGGSLKSANECGTEMPEESTEEEAYEMDHLVVPGVDYIEEDPYVKVGVPEEFLPTAKPQEEAEDLSKMQRRNSDGNGENENAGELESSVVLNGEILI